MLEKLLDRFKGQDESTNISNISHCSQVTSAHIGELLSKNNNITPMLFERRLIRNEVFSLLCIEGLWFNLRQDFSMLSDGEKQMMLAIISTIGELENLEGIDREMLLARLRNFILKNPYLFVSNEYIKKESD